MAKLLKASSKLEVQEVAPPKVSFAFKTLTLKDCKYLIGEDNLPKIEQFIAKKYNCFGTAVNLKTSAFLDIYVLTIFNAKSCRYTEEQLGICFHIMYSIIGSTEAKKKLPVIIAEYRAQLTELCISQCDANWLHKLCEFIETIVLQHINLYKFLCIGKPDECIISTDFVVNVPPPAVFMRPPPLDEGINEVMAEAVKSRHGVTNEVSEMDAAALAQPEKGIAEVEEDVIVAQEFAALGNTTPVASLLQRMAPSDIHQVVQSICDQAALTLSSDMELLLVEKRKKFLDRISLIHNVTK